MKKYWKTIFLTSLIIILLSVGYLLKNERIVYNYGDTFYVFEYFTISLIISFLLVVLFLLVFLSRTIQKSLKS